MTEELKPCPFCHGPAEMDTMDDLVSLVAQLVRALRKADPYHGLSERAADYLKRKGLCGSPLRDTPNV
jgi:hypothetical protein